MLENYIRIDDLAIKEPRIKGTDSDWVVDPVIINNHIKDAFNRVCIELDNYNIDTNLLMDTQVVVYDSTITRANFTSDWVKGDDYLKRLVILSREPRTPFKITLEGSNDLANRFVRELVTLDVDSHFTSTAFSREYENYRIRTESSARPRNNVRVFLVETTYDDLIVFKALELFFTAKYREETGQFYSKMLLYRQKFEAELEIITGESPNDDAKSAVIRIGV